MSATIYSTETLTANDEGTESLPYQDPDGIWTIGIGHNCEANGLPPGICDDAPDGLSWDDGVLLFLQSRGGLTPTEIDALFQHDLAIAAQDLAYCLPTADTLVLPRYAAMIDMTFNLGRDRLLKFNTFLHLMEIGQYAAAAQDLLNNTAVAKQLPERYGRLAQIITSGEWPT